MSQKPPFGLILLFLASPIAWAQESAPVDESAAALAKIFAEGAPVIPKTPELDRTRGAMVFKAEDATYMKGEHFGRWFWPEFTPPRWGRYMVEVSHVSIGSKMGIQFYIGDAKAKGYVPQSGGMNTRITSELGYIYIPDTNTHPAGILSGDDSNGPTFKLQEIKLVPAPEGESITQGIDGSIVLAASAATTFSKKMRYEPKPEKNCLGFWTDKDDWAEWPFSVHDGGKFDLEIFYGCGSGNEGSEVSVWLDDKELNFKVEDTGGFQSWKTHKLGTFEVTAGNHVVTVKPKTQAGKAVMDVQKITLSPAK